MDITSTSTLLWGGLSLISALVFRPWLVGLDPFPLASLIRFPSSIQRPEWKSRLLNTGRRREVSRMQSMLIPGTGAFPGFDVKGPAFQQEWFSVRNQRFTCVRLFHPHMTCLVHAFSVSFTTAAFGRSSIRLFGASTHMVDSEGPSFILCTA